MDRDIIQVIDAMMAVIPEDQVDVRSELQKTQQSARFSAPEIMHLRWNRAAEALTQYLCDPTGVEWKERVAAIFSGKPNA